MATVYVTYRTYCGEVQYPFGILEPFFIFYQTG